MTTSTCTPLADQHQHAVQDALILQIFDEARLEEQEMQQTFSLLGWQTLPLELKITIYADVKGYLSEIEGRYSTACPYVQKRRERVDYWISTYEDGLCTLRQAVDALKTTL